MRYNVETDRDYIEGEYEVFGADKRINRGPEFQMDRRPNYMTYTILGINVVVWILMGLTGLIFRLNQSSQLLLFGAKVNQLIVKGQYWRLFTAMFLHIGITHLFFNSYALYIYGPVVEQLFGKVKFLLIYIIAGLMGSLLSYMFSLNPSAGASGAIFGLMGSLLYFRKIHRNIFDRAVGSRLIMILAINLLYGFIQPGIDNWGHIGGLLGGFLVANGTGLYRSKQDPSTKIMFWGVIALIFIYGLIHGRHKYLPTLL